MSNGTLMFFFRNFSFASPEYIVGDLVNKVMFVLSSNLMVSLFGQLLGRSNPFAACCLWSAYTFEYLDKEGLFVGGSWMPITKLIHLRSGNLTPFNTGELFIKGRQLSECHCEILLLAWSHWRKWIHFQTWVSVVRLLLGIAIYLIRFLCTDVTRAPSKYGKR